MRPAFKSSEARAGFEAEVELNVRSALLSFLELAINVGAMLVPVGQVLFGSNVRVV